MRRCESGARPERRLTFLARGVALLVLLVLVNVVLWIATVATFFTTHRSAVNQSASSRASGLLGSADDAPSKSSSLMSVALIAWTTGLRHALDADHISAIDNATRRIMVVPRRDGLGYRRPVTVGLFFSLGHSTVVLAVVIAVAVSFTTYGGMDDVSNIGGIIGAAVSGSFLFLIGVINTVILIQAVHRMRRVRREAQAERAAKDAELGAAPAKEAEDMDGVARRVLTHPFDTTPPMEDGSVAHVLAEEAERDSVAVMDDKPGTTHNDVAFRGLFTRLAAPLLRVMDRPWKMFPVGILFGLGFDTASTISLLGIALVAGGGLTSNSNASIVLLALLFTAGMSLIDSCDSVLMICAYAWHELEALPTWYSPWEPVPRHNDEAHDKAAALRSDVAHELVLSTTPFALLLTFLSILMAFTVSIIEILGLIGEQCSQCSAAADREAESHDGGLAGRWWLWWRWCNDYFGYIGMGITGLFLLCVIVAFVFTVRRARQRRKLRASARP